MIKTIVNQAKCTKNNRPVHHPEYHWRLYHYLCALLTELPYRKAILEIQSRYFQLVELLQLTAPTMQYDRSPIKLIHLMRKLYNLHSHKYFSVQYNVQKLEILFTCKLLYELIKKKLII